MPAPAYAGRQTSGSELEVGQWCSLAARSRSFPSAVLMPCRKSGVSCRPKSVNSARSKVKPLLAGQPRVLLDSSASAVFRRGRRHNMSSPKVILSHSGNRLLAALPPAEYERLLPALKPVRLVKGNFLYLIGDSRSAARS